MKILFLNALDDPAQGAGAEFTIWTLIRGLKAAGHDCVVLSTSDQKGLNKIEREGVRIWRAGIKNIYWSRLDRRPSLMKRLVWHGIDSYNLLMQNYVQEVLKAEQPDIVSCHNLPGWSAAVWQVISDAGIPFVQVLHDQYLLCARSTMFRDDHNCEKKCADCTMFRLPHEAKSNLPSAVVGVSQFVLDRHTSYGYFKDVPVKRVIRNTRQAAHLEITTQGSLHDGVRFGFIGRLDPPKGIEDLLEAFMRYERPNAELWIAGDGLPEYRKLLKEKYRDSRIRFLGRISQKEFYPEIDVVVVPSLWNDTLPGVVFESFAFGKPVIGSSRGGIPEMIENGKNGLIFNPDNHGELLGAIQVLGEDDALRKEMGENSSESAIPFLDVDTWLKKYFEIYSLVSR